MRASLPATIEIYPQLRSEAIILANPTQISQVIMNLCTNAFHAMENTGGRLTITLNDIQVPKSIPAAQVELSAGSYLVLNIQDTGTGIDPTIMPKIFEPYFTTKEVGKGTGLGLATVMGIVKNHGGEIILESKLGHGTMFSLFFPIINQLPEQTPKELPILPRAFGRILFVDDEPSLAELGKATLTKLGYQVTAVTNGKEALEIFQARPHEFDLVITDLTMPRFTGLDLAKHFHSQRPDLPIIICTGYRDRLRHEEVKFLGVREVLFKPFEMTKLGETVQNVLKSYPCH